MLFEGIIAFGFVIISFLTIGALGIAAIMILVVIIRNLLGLVGIRFDIPFIKKRKRTPDLSLTEGLKDLIQDGKVEEALQAYQKFTGQDEHQARIALQKLADTINAKH